jgi:hypothetical protein
MSEAYVETTILTDALLKKGSKKQAMALAALARYDRTSLPVYSIKEWKNGPLSYFAYLHGKLVTTKSLARTYEALSALRQQPYRMATTLEALAAVERLLAEAEKNYSGLGQTEDEKADCYRVQLELLIIRSWNKRRDLTTNVVGELACYTEAPPMKRKDGLLDLKPRLCDRDQQCCLASELKANPRALEALLNAVPSNSKRIEDNNRRKILKRLIKHPHEVLNREDCRKLGDAIFAFFCPDNACILTTNLKDHAPLAEALGKCAEST